MTGSSSGKRKRVSSLTSNGMKTRDFRRVSSQKLSSREGGLLLKVGSGQPGAAPRLGIVVSKKVAKLAVRRNRIRRVLREAARKELELMGEGKDFVLIVLPGFEPPKMKEVQALLHRLFNKVSLR